MQGIFIYISTNHVLKQYRKAHICEPFYFMKTRRHHNNKGFRQIRRGKTKDQVRQIASRLGLKFAL